MSIHELITDLEGMSSVLSDVVSDGITDVRIVRVICMLNYLIGVKESEQKKPCVKRSKAS